MNESLFKCLCDSRGLSSSISKVLDNPELTPEEKSVIYDALLDVQTAANKIQAYCDVSRETYNKK